MAKQHTSWIGWASDHWFLSFLLVGSAIAIPVRAFAAAKDAAGGPPPPSPFLPTAPPPLDLSRPAPLLFREGDFVLVDPEAAHVVIHGLDGVDVVPSRPVRMMVLGFSNDFIPGGIIVRPDDSALKAQGHISWQAHVPASAIVSRAT